jgi:tetratricopeptide (TPR) repeat protein
VQKHYLTAFDKPPIDNIREMVVADKSIRDAIVEIDYNKGSEVADNIKSKLYLAGIINYEENDIKIKNRIIRNSLSRAWLESVKEQEQGLLKIALELFEKGKYTEAISCYEKFMATNEFPDKESESFAHYHLGIAFYKSFQFEKAIEFLSKSNFAINEYPKLAFRNKNIIGLCYYYLDNFEKSIECFKFVIENSNKDELYGRALLNYGGACINSDSDSLKTEAISVFKQLTLEENFDKNYITEIEIDELKSISNYNLGLLHKDSNLIEAKSYFEKALETKKVELKPIFYLNLINSSSESKEKENLISTLIDCVIDNKILPVEKDPERPLDISIDKLEEIIILAFQINIVSFEKILNYSLSKVYSPKEIVEVLCDIAVVCLKTEKWEAGVDILKYSYTKFHSEIIQNKNIHQYSTLKLLAYFVKANDNITYSEEYLHSFGLKRHEPIDYTDFDIVSYTIFELIAKKEYEKASKYLNLFYSLKLEVNENLLINYLVLKHLDLQVKSLTGNSIEANVIAKDILDDINNKKYKNEKSNLLGEKGIEDIKTGAYNYLHPYQIKQPVRVEKSYGRNEVVKVRYNDGRIEEKKFKKVEIDIVKQLCKIISN